MAQRLRNQRVLVTQADDYMGPATISLFQQEGAEVIADTSDLTQPGACEDLIEQSGRIDVLIANLASRNYSGIAATDVDDDAWHDTFDRMVHPLHRLCRAVIPQMIERSAGKVVVYGSATALTGLKTVTAYSAARAALVASNLRWPNWAPCLPTPTRSSGQACLRSPHRRRPALHRVLRAR